MFVAIIGYWLNLPLTPETIMIMDSDHHSVETIKVCISCYLFVQLAHAFLVQMFNFSSNRILRGINFELSPRKMTIFKILKFLLK